MPTNAHRRRRIDTGGPWGTGLLLLGAGLILNGFGYIAADPRGLPDALKEISEYAPIWAWGVLWMAAGSYSIIKALSPPQRHIDVWAAIAITSLWSINYFISWLIDVFEGDPTREWAGALSWAMLAGSTLR